MLSKPILSLLCASLLHVGHLALAAPAALTDNQTPSVITLTTIPYPTQAADGLQKRGIRGSESCDAAIEHLPRSTCIDASTMRVECVNREDGTVRVHERKCDQSEICFNAPYDPVDAICVFKAQSSGSFVTRADDIELVTSMKTFEANTPSGNEEYARAAIVLHDKNGLFVPFIWSRFYLVEPREEAVGNGKHHSETVLVPAHSKWRVEVDTEFLWGATVWIASFQMPR